MPPDGTRPDGTRPKGARPKGARPEGARPEGAPPEGARPEGARPEGAPTQAARLSDEPLVGAALTLRDIRAGLFDAAFYLINYPDIRRAGIDPWEHYEANGAAEFRAPNPYFDPVYYRARYADARMQGVDALTHYIRYGAPELRDPHPQFDAVYYADRHPEARANPLLHFTLYGSALGYATKRPPALADYMPSRAAAKPAPADLRVDIVIPVYRGLAETRKCLRSVLADRERPPGEIIVIDDVSPERALSAWLRQEAAQGRIRLIVNPENQGFVRSANIGMRTAAGHDVVLLNADTEVPQGWLRRLAGHAYANARIATVSPFSNNATICGYPSLGGSGPPFGLDTGAIDAACQAANRGRAVRVPVTVGFAMYIKRAALREIGDFDADAFGRGYGEESDFCMRAAAKGWSHRLACDVYLHHQGSVSFGAQEQVYKASQEILNARYPGYRDLIDRHVRIGDANAARWATTAALFRRAGLPALLFVSHNLGGGVQTHIDRLVTRYARQANVLLLHGDNAGSTMLSVPALPGHPPLLVQDEWLRELAIFLRAAQVRRVHIHHTATITTDLQALIAALGVPFDITIHDWHFICPQINLLPRKDAHYCGEPDAAGCNACLAAHPQPGAPEILHWRARSHWLLTHADRVLCPSEDGIRRLARYGLAGGAVLAPHEAVTEAAWTLRLPPRPGDAPLRIALLGVLADHKGLNTVLEVARAAQPGEIELHVIGYLEERLPLALAKTLRETGPYEPEDLPQLLAEVDPHILWLPAQWPETYSFTLSAAIESGRPIVASDIGAFPERLRGRPLTWLVEPDGPAEEWLAVFEALRDELNSAARAPRGRRATHKDYYAEAYLQAASGASPMGAPRKPGKKPAKPVVVVIPETYTPFGAERPGFTPCAYIRLLLPLAALARDGGAEVIIATPSEALQYRPDVIVTQRYALSGQNVTERLIAHAQSQGIRLVYDLDDDLVRIPDDHPEAAELQPRAAAVQRLAQAADVITVSTLALAERLRAIGRPLQIRPNTLDAPHWRTPAPAHISDGLPVRLLMMGTQTHDRDLALILPALERLRVVHQHGFHLEVIGVTGAALPGWIHRGAPPPQAGGTYPGFVQWLCAQTPWHVGLAPLLDTPFNRSKSAIKTLDYAALGLGVLASDVPSYQGSLAAGAGGLLLPNAPEAWFKAIQGLIINRPRLHAMRLAAHAAFQAASAAAAANDAAIWRLVLRTPI